MSEPTSSPTTAPTSDPTIPRRRFDDHHAPDLAARHPGCSQDSDLPDALEHAHRQGVHDSEPGHEDGNQGQGIEQAECAIEGIAHHSRDAVQAHRLEA